MPAGPLAVRARSFWRRRARHVKNLLLATLVTFLAGLLIAYPDTGVEAARDGLHIFLEIVFPSLLPFFILSEFFLAFGVVHFLGVLLEPLMRPVFNVPGVGAFALSMGLAAGYPMDAVITARFRRQGLCSRVEGERLLAFTNTADPLFILGAVAVGMFGRPDLGALLAAAHYLSAFSVGVLFRFHGTRGRRAVADGPAPAGGKRGIARVSPSPSSGWIRRAFGAMQRARQEDGRTLGALLNDSVQESINTLLRIGGFIMFFSVLSALLLRSGLLRRIAWPVAMLLQAAGIDPDLAPPVIAGLLELDIGTAQAAALPSPLLDRLVVASAIIAWSGLSVHGQVASIVYGTDLRMGPYALARLTHALLAAVFLAAGYRLLPPEVSLTLTGIGFVPEIPWVRSVFTWLAGLRNWPATYFGSPALAFGLLVLLALASSRRPSPGRRRWHQARSAPRPTCRALPAGPRR